MLGVIGAMGEEVQLLLNQMTDVRTSVHAEISVTKGSYKIALAQSGIGRVNATICTQMLIDLYQPAKLVFSGVAGGLLPNMPAGDIIVASYVVQYDMDLTAFGWRRGEAPGRDRLIECHPDLVGKATAAFDAAFDDFEDAPNLMLGTIASGDKFVQGKAMQRWLQREFAALSDSSGETASDDFEENLQVACRNSFQLMDRMIPIAMREREHNDRRRSD